MRTIFSTLAIGLTASFALNANAALVTEYYTSTVTSVDNISGISIFDTFDWSVTFDDEGRRMTMYHDGPDGIANTSDDTLAYEHCLSGASDGCTTNLQTYNGSHSLFSDATLDLSSLSGVTGANFASSRNGYNTNLQRAFNSLDGSIFRQAQADSFNFNSHVFAGGSAGWYQLHGFDDASGVAVDARITFTSDLIRTVAADVPEPATLALFGLGLAGLGMSRRKAK